MVLLHCYPYEREAGYLAQAFNNVHLDVGLSVNHLGARAAAFIARTLELAPFRKILYSSDGFGPPELHYLGSALWRKGIGAVLGDFVAGEEPLPEETVELHLRSQALRRALREQADGVAHARAADVRHAQASLDLLRKRQRRKVVAMGLDHQANHRAALDIERAGHRANACPCSHAHFRTASHIRSDGVAARRFEEKRYRDVVGRNVLIPVAAGDR